MSQFETITADCQDSIMTVTIDRPKVLNALNGQVLDELQKTVVEAQRDSSLKAFILRGAGEKAFVAGADIAEMSKMSVEQALHFARIGQSLTKSIENLPMVTIAAVQGFALGGGCELAMACDIIVATKNALFGQPEVDLGLIPGFGGTQRLPRKVSPSLAMEMLCCGRKLNGEEAQAAGLVSRLCEEGSLEQGIEKLIKGIKKAGPAAIKETKRLTQNALDMNISAGLEAEAHAFAANFSNPQAEEGVNAFLEKRRASFPE